MFGKNKNKKVGLCVMVVTSCFILAGLWAVLATPETALAVKPDKPGGGGGGDKVPTCVKFDDVGSVVGDQENAPYCHNKKENITVKFSHDGHLVLNTNSTDKAGNGRGIFIDFGTPVTLAPGTDNEMTINTTADNRLRGVSAKLNVGASQDEFDFFDMEVGPENSKDKVNLRILVWFYFTDGRRDNLLIQLAPNDIGTDRYCPSSDSVTVTYDGIDEDTQLHEWRVETQEVVQGAGISRMGADDSLLLIDVITPGLDPGHIALSFGFTVTAAP